MMRDLRVLFKTTGGGRRFIRLLLLRCPFDAMFTLLLASFLQLSFQAIRQGSSNGLFAACAVLGIGSLMLFLYNGMVWAKYASYAVEWCYSLRCKLFRHLSGISLQQMEERPSGDWLTRLNADVQQASALLNQPLHLAHAATATVGMGLSSVFLWMIQPSLYLLTLLFLLPHLVISQWFMARPMAKLSAQVQEATACHTTQMNALITCADTAIMYDAMPFLLSRFEATSLSERKTFMMMKSRQAVGGTLLTLLGMLGFLIILLVGGRQIAEGSLTFGELTASFQYRGGILAGSLMLANSLVSIQTALAGVHRVNETMAIQSEELKALGFSLAKIKSLLAGGTTNEQFQAALTRKRAAWQDAIATAEHKIAAIDAISLRLSKSKAAAKLAELSDEERAWLLVQMVCVEDLRGQSMLSEAIWL